MPQRFLRPGITNSTRFNSIKWETQSFLVRIFTLVDDFGRCDGRPAVLLGNCFAVWNDRHRKRGVAVNLQQVAQMLQQLAATRLISLYEDRASGKRVLQVEQWQERIRTGVVAKWPSKTADSRDLLQLADILQQDYGELQPSSPTSSPTPASAPEVNVPPAVPQGGRERKLLDLPSDERQALIDSAKKRICRLPSMNGKDPSRPWSREAMGNLIEILPIPENEWQLIEWFHGLPADDSISELKNRRQSEVTLSANWADEVSRALRYRHMRHTAARPRAGAEPPLWREFFRFKYGPEVRLPHYFSQLEEEPLKEWTREHEDWEAARGKKEKVAG